MKLPRPYCTDEDFVEPSPLAMAIQMPLNDPHWQSRVLNGYVKTSLQKVQRTHPRAALEPTP